LGDTGCGSFAEVDENPPHRHIGLEEEEARAASAPELEVAPFAMDSGLAIL
jgi:hypothetical protein